MYSINVDKLISETKDFLNKHSKEIVILDFNHLYQKDNQNDNTQFIKKLTKAFDNKMAPNSMSSNNTVKEFWSSNCQIITLYKNADSVNNCPKIWSQDNISSPWPNINSLDKIYKLKSFLLEKLSRRPDNKFFVLQGILTPDGSMIVEDIAKDIASNISLFIKLIASSNTDPTSIEDVAKEVTPQVVECLTEWKDKNMNIVIVDWFNCANFVATIRQINIDRR